MSCSQENKKLVHHYLDEDISLLEKKEIEFHINKCESCQHYLQELRQTLTILQSTTKLKAPSNLSANVMKQLPKQQKRVAWKNWLKRHPFMVTAATFFFVFLLSISSTLSGSDQEISVKGEGQFFIDKERGVVVIPEGERVAGNILVRNGNVEVLGEVSGNVTVINGEHLMASSAQITGEVEEINQMFEWLWYEMKSLFSDFSNAVRSNDESNNSDS